MRFKSLILILLFTLAATPALAQTNPAPMRVSFDNFAFSFEPGLATGVAISQVPGDPKTLEQPGGPEVKHTEFLLYSGSAVPAPFDATAAIRIYKVADFAGYTEQQTRLKALQALLKSKPDLGRYMKPGNGGPEESLPFLPVLPAAQVIRARAQYIETPSLRGISFVTIFQQGLAPFTSGDFMVTFQGLSANGSTYISAIFRPTVSVFPKDIPADFNMDAFANTFNSYREESIAKLNKAKSEEFTPSLASMEAVMRSFTVPTAP
jgi:hypothetical protein